MSLIMLFGLFTVSALASLACLEHSGALIDASYIEDTNDIMMLMVTSPKEQEAMAPEMSKKHEARLAEIERWQKATTGLGVISLLFVLLAFGTMISGL